MNKDANRYQRAWRRNVALQVEAKLGKWCRGCETLEEYLVVGEQTGDRKLFIPDRRGEDLAKYGNNTVIIYSHFLKGILPPDRITIFCPDCMYEAREKEKEAGEIPNELETN